MSLLRLLPLLLGFAVAGYGTPAPASPGPRNLFVELLGKTDTAVAAKVDAAWRQLFYGDNDTQRVYYPVGADMAYGAEAQSLLRTMRHKGEDPDRGDTTAMFDPAAKQVVFEPHGEGATFTDPSYHLPAFTTLWSRWAAAPADRTFYAEVTATSRAFFHRAAHPQTGLMPDYADFDGRPRVRGGHENFRYDGLLQLLGLLQAGGRFQIHPPPTP